MTDSESDPIQSTSSPFNTPPPAALSLSHISDNHSDGDFDHTIQQTTPSPPSSSDEFSLLDENSPNSSINNTVQPVSDVEMADEAINRLTETLSTLQGYSDQKQSLLLLDPTPFSGTPLEKAHAHEHWNKFERHVLFQRASGKLQEIRDVYDKFCTILSSPALDWAKALDLREINTLAKLKEAFLRRYNPYGTSAEELDRAWDELQFNDARDDIDAFLDKIQYLSLLSDKTEHQKVKKLKKCLPKIFQLQAVNLTTMDEVAQLYRRTHHLLKDLTPHTTNTTSGAKPAGNSSVFLHDPYQNVSQQDPTTTSTLQEMRQDIDNLKHAQTIRQNPRHLTPQTQSTTHAPRGNNFQRNYQPRGHRGGRPFRPGQSRGFRGYQGNGRGRPNNNFQRNWNQNGFQNQNRYRNNWRNPNRNQRGYSSNQGGYRGQNRRGFQGNYNPNYRQNTHQMALPAADTTTQEQNNAPPGAITCPGCLTFQHNPRYCPETTETMANLHKMFEQWNLH